MTKHVRKGDLAPHRTTDVSEDELLEMVGESACANAPAPEKETYAEFLARLAIEQKPDRSQPDDSDQLAHK